MRKKTAQGILLTILASHTFISQACCGISPIGSEALLIPLVITAIPIIFLFWFVFLRKNPSHKELKIAIKTKQELLDKYYPGVKIAGAIITKSTYRLQTNGTIYSDFVSITELLEYIDKKWPLINAKANSTTD